MRPRVEAYALLLSRGAPALAPGEFYRVRRDMERRTWLEIRRTRRRFGSRLLQVAPVIQKPGEEILDAIARAAASAMRSLSRDGDLDALRGDHHP